MSRTHSETRWAIAYRPEGDFLGGLSATGTWTTRKNAILAHVYDPYSGYDERPTPDQARQRWAYRRKQGDYAVKVTITWQEPAA